MIHIFLLVFLVFVVVFCDGQEITFKRCVAIFAKFVDGADRSEFPFRNDPHAVANLFHDVQNVGTEKDRAAVLQCSFIISLSSYALCGSSPVKGSSKISSGGL